MASSKNGRTAISSESDRAASLGWPATLAILLVVLLTASLGNWQLNRADERLRAQAERDALAAREPVALTVASLQTGLPMGSQVTVTGSWLPDRTVFLDNRTHNRQAGFHVFTPLRLAGSEPSPLHVLVLRGWAPRHNRDRTALPPVKQATGEITVSGMLEADVEQTLMLGDAEVPGTHDKLWQQVSLSGFGQWSGLPLASVLVRQTGPAVSVGAQPEGLIREWTTPGSKVDRHYGYAFQWFAMSAAMLAFWLWLKFFRRTRGRA